MVNNYKPGWMTEELIQLGDAVRRFSREYLEPNDLAWRENKQATRDAWKKAGELGLILADVPEQYGGPGGTPAHCAVIWDEISYSGNSGLGLGLNHLVGHYILRYGTEEQKLRWLPGLVSGEIIAAIAMTEPGTGSDLQGVRTRADKKGDTYVINGAKTFISNGQMCDVVLLGRVNNQSFGANAQASCAKAMKLRASLS